jgi:hypothetical protein
MSAKTAEPDAKHVTNYCAIRRREKKVIMEAYSQGAIKRVLFEGQPDGRCQVSG